MRINVGDFLARRAMLSPEGEGLGVGGQRFSFRELNRRADRLAAAMKKLGVRSGDRVGILALNGAPHFDLFFGLARIGAIMVPINHRLAPPELGSIFQDSGIDVLVLDPAFKPAVDASEVSSFKRVYLAEPAPDGQLYDELLDQAGRHESVIQAGDDDPLAIIYTIWSTGRPRGVVLSHNNFYWSAASIIATLHHIGPAFLLPLPFFHIGALGWLPFFMHRGSKCVLLPHFDPEAFLDLINRENITSFGAVPTMLQLLRQSPNFKNTDLRGLRSIFAYGQAVPVELIQDYARFGVTVRQLYGLTESAGPALVIDYENALKKAGSCGQPFFLTQIQLVDHDGREVFPGEIGEIVIDAKHVMRGYWDQPEATQDAVRGGRLFTGDLARQDPDGYFYIVDRKKDLIISGGENIFPAEVERVLFQHFAVADAAVIGVPDQLWGEIVKAFIVKKSSPSLSPEDLTNFLKGKIASYKIPRLFEFVDSLPRTSTGKMEKKKLRG
jgi:fatty-acyl-CoA synthase